MKVVLEYADGNELELGGLERARFIEFQWNDLTIWGSPPPPPSHTPTGEPAPPQDEMPVEMYIIDCGRHGNEIRVWDLLNGHAAEEDGVTDKNVDYTAERVTVFP